jgi:RHS repeat-associated protein
LIVLINREISAVTRESLFAMETFRKRFICDMRYRFSSVSHETDGWRVGVVESASQFHESGSGYRKVFAWIASIVMLLVVFQVVADSAGAVSEEDMGAVSAEPATNVTAAPSDLSDSSNVNSVEPLTPVYGDIPGGGVDSYGLAATPTIAGLGEIIAQSHVSCVQGNTTVSTQYGNYAVNASNPAYLSVSHVDGTPLVQESCFVLKSPKLSTAPANGRLVEASSEKIVVQYDLVDSKNKSSYVATVEVSTVFAPGATPKITVSVLATAAGVAEWSVVWLIVPSKGARILNDEARDISSSLDVYLGQSVPAADLSVKLTVISSNTKSSADKMQISWKDAKEGVLTVEKVNDSSGNDCLALQVTFEKGKAEIDPTIVASSTSATPTDLSCQRKVVWYGGYYWAFYDRGDTICYKSSADGQSWSTENALPEGTALAAGRGFDVYARDGKIGVGWIDSGILNAYFKSGTFMGSKILWNARSIVTGLAACFSGVSVTIGTDGTFFVFVQWRMTPYPSTLRWSVFNSTNGLAPWNIIGPSFDAAYSNSNTWNVILPFGSGDLALVETSQDYTNVRVRYWYSQYGPSLGWLGPWDYVVGIASGAKGDKFSAVVGLDGTINIAMKNTGGCLRYVYIAPNGGPMLYHDLTTTAISGYPSISLDENDDLHVFWLDSSTVIKHVQKVGPTIDGWSAADTFYTSATAMTGLTSWVNPVGTHTLVWTSLTSPKSVMFGSIPLPYGTPGAAAEPWSRDGLSPYGTYFSTYQDYLSPGSGQLYLLEKDVSIPGRGVDLSVSRIYQQPKYFRVSDGQPYMSFSFPWCNLGPGWSLDLPWMDQNYVYTGDGQRFIIMWGNTGDPFAFENHDSIHFILRQRTQSTPHGGLQFYELVMSSGMRCVFDHSDYKLVEISDLRGYDAYSGEYSDSYNILWLNYDYTYNRITSIEESDLGRMITFSYNVNGMLQTITRPDIKTFSFGYTIMGGKYYLTSVTDPLPLNRVTTFGYTGLGTTPVNYLLTSVQFPSNSKNVYTYTQDSSAGTEVRSWLATQQKTVDASTSALIRQTDYTYKIVSGKVRFVNAADKNEAGVVQGRTESVFVSNLKYSSETKKDAAGVQLSRSDTWYDQAGQPMRVDTYKGGSQGVNYSEYTSYDDWGNVIFTKNAMGYESYASCANTKTQNSFQGGSLLTRTSSGKIFYDAFDDWDMGDWPTILQAGNTVTLDGSADPANAPAMKITQNVAGAAIAYHKFAQQTSDFIIQTRFMTSTGWPTYIEGHFGTDLARRLCFYAWGGWFYWYDLSGTHQITEVPCVINTWYDVGFSIHYATNSYDIYIDGQRVSVTNQPMLQGTNGYIDSVLFQAGDIGQFTTEWIDNLRIYRSLIVTVSMGAGYVAELYDGIGNLLDRSKMGSLTVAAMPLNFPSGYIKISKIGEYSFQTPMMDIWGGDTYSMSVGVRSSSLPKTSIGFGAYLGKIADDTFFGTAIDSGADRIWVSDSDYAVSGSSYHESRYYEMSHYHGFLGGEAMTVPSTDVLIQYVWLTEGKMPQEIMVQFHLNDGTWRRAYWNGTAHDIISYPPGYVPYSSQYMGQVPQITGKWVQLTVRATELGISGTASVDGVIYGLYGGTARWDLTSRMSRGVYVYGLSPTQTVELWLDDDNYRSGISSTQPVILDLYGSGTTAEKTLPLSGYFKVLEGSKLVYQSPWIPEIWNLDQFTFSATNWYPNAVKTDGGVKGIIHDRQVGSFNYQDVARTATQEAYTKYSPEGDANETKAKLGSGWVYSRATYDLYGNQVTSIDPTGRGTGTVYSNMDSYTYPVQTNKIGLGPLGDTFETDTSWTPTKSGSGGYTYWMDSSYSTLRSHSPTHSVKLNFSCSIRTYDTGVMTMYKNYTVGKVYDLSLWMYIDTFLHDGGGGVDTMDSGIRMHLYNSAGVDYADYTYWLASWSGSANHKHPSDQNSILVYEDPTLGTWLNPTMHPQTDFPNADWSSCAKVKLELYIYASYAYQDSFKVFYDDVSFSGGSYSYEPVTYTYNQNNGWLLSQTDALGQRTNYSYDALGRVIWTQYADGSRKRAVYDDVNNKVTLYDEQDHKTVNSYDKIGRLALVERYGSGSTVYSDVHYSYNWQDQVASYTDELSHVTSSTYDYLGRQTRVTSPDNSYRTTVYADQSNTVTSTDEVGHKVAQVSDDLGRLNATWEYYTSSSYYQTLMGYDAVGELLTVKDANGKVTRMAYDQLGRMTRTTHPDNLYDSATYDSAGRVLTKTDRAGQTTTSAYDYVGHLTTMTNPSDTIRYTYDAIGQRTVSSNNLGSITCTYDKRGRTTSQVEVIGTNSYTVRFGYDIGGRQTWILYPDNVNVTYAYDSYDRITSISKGGTTLLTVNIYNVDDSVQKETTGGTEATTFTYNNRDWTKKIEMKIGSTVKFSLSYWFYADGNVKHRVTNAGLNDTFSYDNLERLTKATGNGTGNWGTLSYTYDAVGNRLTGEGVTDTITGYNQLNRTDAGSTSYWYNYDRNGNQIWKNRTVVTSGATRYNYQFNGLDQLTQAVKWTRGSNSWSSSILGSYWYDANGARAKTTEGSTTIEYVFAGHNPLSEKTGTTTSDYVYAGGSLKAKLVGTTTYYYISDPIGGTWQVWKQGTTNNPYFSVKNYRPFGTPNGASGTEKVKFAGEIQDSSTGLYYIFARYYDPELGRFISLDPQLGKLSSPQTLNRYVYCINSPLRFTDPTGEWFGISLKTTLQVLIIVVAVAATVATAGIASPLAAMAVGAAIGAISSGASTALAGGSLSEIATSALIGGVAGAIGGGIGAGVTRLMAGKATSLAAENLAKGFPGSEVKLVSWGAKLSRTYKTGMEFGKEGGSGFFAPGKVLFKEFKSVKEIETLTGKLWSGTPEHAGLFRADRPFYAVVRPSEMGGGSLPFEYIVPYGTATKYLSLVKYFDLSL